MTLYNLFYKQYQRRPNAVALVFKDNKTTFKKLYHKVNSLIHLLNEQIEMSSIFYLPIMPERNEDFIVMLLTALKLSIPYVPIAASTPIRRVKTILNDLQSKILLTSDRQIKIQGVQSIYFNENCHQGVIDETPIVNESGLDMNDASLAYVCYTSGSTGKPKGVCIKQSAICNLTDALQKKFQLNSRDVILQFSSVGFDVHVSEIFLWLDSGAKLLLIDDELRHSPSLLQDYILQHKVTYASLPPLVLSMFEKKPLPSLKWIVMAGELPPAKTTEYWPSQCKLMNAYGPTEATVYSSMGELTLNGPVNNIGYPLAGYRYFILDEWGDPIRDDKVGELCIAGLGLATKYINNPHETKAGFSTLNIDNESVRVYLTGDLVKQDEQGKYCYLGRNDEQIKIRGHRVELNEIACVATEHEHICMAVALAHSCGLQKMIVLFFMSDEEILVETLRMHMKESLPDYMCPSKMIRVNEIPTLPSGKVDKKFLLELISLPQKSSFAIDSKIDDWEQGNPLLGKVVEIYRQTLEVDDIKPDSDFFDLGGNSLLAVQLLAKLNIALSAAFVMRDIYEASTPEKLYRRL